MTTRDRVQTRVFADHPIALLSLLAVAIGSALCISCGERSPRDQALSKLRSWDPQLRFEAVKSLGSMPPDERILDVLIRGVEDDDWQVRGASIKALGGFGKDALHSVPALVVALDDDVPDVVVQVPLALAKMGPEPDALWGLCEALANSHAGVQAEAARALGAFGPDAARSADVVRSLVDTLVRSEDSEVVVAVIHALGEIRPHAAFVLDALEGFLDDSRLEVRDAARNAMSAIQEDSVGAPP
jgi:HEAT repeat protein